MSGDPMDFVCSLVGVELDPHIRLPNPNYPHDAPTVIRRHCTDDVTTAQAWGNGGSGPAVVALNTMPAFLSGESGSTAWDGVRFSAAAEALYQSFKDEFLANRPKEEGVVPALRVRVWIQARSAAAATA